MMTKSLAQKVLLVSAAVLCLAIVSWSSVDKDQATGKSTQGKAVITDVDPADGWQALKADPSIQVVDVRTPGEYRDGHLQGAKLIDYHGSDYRAQLERLDPSRPCLVYCASGGRSRKALKNLESLGFERIIHLPGGFNAWQRAGLPIAKD